MINFYKKLQNIFKSKQDKAKNKFVLNPEYFKEKNVPINLNNEQAREVACMYNDVRNAILRFSKNPVAFEALWDGDTSGWFLDLFVVFEGDNDSEKYYSKSIYILTFGTDMRVFQTENPFWSESTVAKLIGEEISKSFNIPFWFPSPDEATSECPHWFEQDRAVKCINCAKPFLIKSQYLSKSVCYHCQLRIERKEKERETEIKKSENFKPLHELGYIFAVLKNNRVIDKGFIRHDSKCMKFLYRDFQEIGFKKKDFLSTFSDISYSTDECKQLIKRINEYIDHLIKNYLHEYDKERNRFNIPSLFKKLNFYEKPFHSWLPVDSIIITLAEFKEFLEMKTDENLLYVYGNESLRDNSTSILSYLINKKGHSADKAEIQKFYKFPKDEFDKMIEKMIKAECIFERAGYIILTLKGFAVADYGVYHGVSNEISI